MFAEEVVLVDTFDARRRTVTVERDEHLRPGTTMEALAVLEPAFRNSGTVTAGNSSGSATCRPGRDGRRDGPLPAASGRWPGSPAGPAPGSVYVSWAGGGPGHPGPLGRLGWDLLEVDVWSRSTRRSPPRLSSPATASSGSTGNGPTSTAAPSPLATPSVPTGARIVGTAVHQLQRGHARRGLATLRISGGPGHGRRDRAGRHRRPVTGPSGRRRDWPHHDHGGWRAARAGRPGHPVGRAAGRRRPDYAAHHGDALAWPCP